MTTAWVEQTTKLSELESLCFFGSIESTLIPDGLERSEIRLEDDDGEDVDDDDFEDDEFDDDDDFDDDDFDEGDIEEEEEEEDFDDEFDDDDLDEHDEFVADDEIGGFDSLADGFDMD